MPIRLNLLAEAQAAEELRRRDPLKRAIWGAALAVSLMLVWSSSLFLKGVLANSEVMRIQAQTSARTNQYQRVINNQQQIQEIRQKLTALRQLSTNRFLNATLLNALQQTTVEDVQLIRLKAEQTYTLVEASKPQPQTNENRALPGKPATQTEKIVVTLEGNDFSQGASAQFNQLKESIAAHPYFREQLAKTNGISLKHLASPTLSQGKPYVLFALECRYPEKKR